MNRPIWLLGFAGFLALAACDEKPSEDMLAEEAAKAAGSAKPVATPPEAPEPEANQVAVKKPKKRPEDCPKGNEVEIENADLEAEVRKKLAKEKGPITKADLASVKSVNLVQTSLDQLDVCVFPHMTNLKQLYLGRGEIDDLSPISELVHLEGLRASMNPIVDLKPLEKLTKMDRLDLGHTQARDLKPLSGMTALTDLQLDDTPVEDLSPLAELDKLERLSVQRTRVKDFSPLKDLESLEFIYVKGTPATDISPLLPLKEKNGLRIIDQ